MHIGIMQILDHTYFLPEATLMTIITKYGIRLPISTLKINL